MARKKSVFFFKKNQPTRKIGFDVLRTQHEFQTTLLVDKENGTSLWKKY